MSDGRGFLTKTDREFLRGGKEYTGENAKQQRYERREAIAARTRQAFHDFALLYDTLDEHERDRIFDPPRDDVFPLHDAVRDTLSFLYWGIEREPGEKGPHRSFFYRFDQLFESAIRRGEKRRHDERVMIDYDPYTVERVQAEAGWVEQVADDLAENGGRGIPDKELRGAIQTLAEHTTGEREHSDYLTVDGEPLEEWLGVTDLHDLADYVAQKADESDDVDE